MKISFTKQPDGSVLVTEGTRLRYIKNGTDIEVMCPNRDSVDKTISIRYGRNRHEFFFADLDKVNGVAAPAVIDDAVALLSSSVFNFGGGIGIGGANYWTGKNIMVIADSYFADNYVTPYLTDNITANVINKSVGNTTVTPGYKNPGLSYWDRIQAAGYISGSNPDLVVIWGSVNEPFGQTDGSPVPIGTINDSESGTPTTFYGALKQVILKIMAVAPNARIVLTTNVIILQTASRGTYSTQKGYRDAIIAVGQRYSVPVLDLQTSSGFTFENNNIWLGADQVHPTAPGGKLLARQLVNFIKQL